MSAISGYISYYDQQIKNIAKSIKEEYPEITLWLEERGIELDNLGHYVKSLAAVALVSVTVFTTATFALSNDPESIPSIKKEQDVFTLNSDSLPNPTTEQQEAIDVWNKYSDEIIQASNKYQVDPKIIFSTIMVESRGNPSAYRYEPLINDASYGLGQILYGTAVLIGFEGTANELNDPEINIDIIARYHRYNMDVYGKMNIEQLATAYNAGNPYSKATYGHVDKFKNWYQLMDGLLAVNPINYY